MEAIQQTVNELSEHFNTRMAEFQHNIQSTIPAASPTSNINAQFTAFRSFILSALESLQSQVQLLSRQQEDMEMRSRRKILLVHGVPETKNEKVGTAVVKVLSDQLKSPDLHETCISRCHRLGSPRPNKPRAILIKFHDLTIRNKLWFSKSGLKDSGITLSEFLTKQRHDVFMAARQRLGVAKCWTKDGRIVVLGPNGTRHQIASISELNVFAPESEVQAPRQKAPTASTSSANLNPKVIKALRPKKVTRDRKSFYKY